MRTENEGIAQTLAPAICTCTLIVSCGPYISEYYFYYTILVIVFVLISIKMITLGPIQVIFRAKHYKNKSKKKREVLLELSKECVCRTGSNGSTKSERRKMSFNKIKRKISTSLTGHPVIYEESHL